MYYFISLCDSSSSFVCFRFRGFVWICRLQKGKKAKLNLSFLKITHSEIDKTRFLYFSTSLFFSSPVKTSLALLASIKITHQAHFVEMKSLLSSLFLLFVFLVQERRKAFFIFFSIDTSASQTLHITHQSRSHLHASGVRNPK